MSECGFSNTGLSCRTLQPQTNCDTVSTPVQYFTFEVSMRTAQFKMKIRRVSYGVEILSLKFMSCAVNFRCLTHTLNSLLAGLGI